MKLDSITLDAGPSQPMKIIQAKKQWAHMKTWGGVAIFDWGATIVGETDVLSFRMMTASEYGNIYDKYIAGDTVLLDLEDGEGEVPARTFNIKILDFYGAYLHKFGTTNVMRQDVRMEILYLSQVS